MFTSKYSTVFIEDSGGFRNWWGVEPGRFGDKSPPTGSRSWRHILKITIAHIVSCDHCIKLEVAILSQWIKIVSTVSVFSFFYPTSCDAHGRRGGMAAPLPPVNPPLREDTLETVAATTNSYNTCSYKAEYFWLSLHSIYQTSFSGTCYLKTESVLFLSNRGW